jgi:Family of unknown function (DUF5689)/Domain of unknown function (DUF5017)
MHTFLKNSISVLLLTLGIAIIGTSCKKKFDEPPVYVTPTVTANATIKQVKALLLASGDITKISDDLIIRGIVTADDKSGNYYKTIVIQDATGAIAVLLDGTNLFNNYPIGREVFIKCKDLYLGDYNRLIQIGGGIDASGTTPQLAAIPSALFNRYIIRGSYNNVVVPKVVTIAELTTNMQDSLQNRLIQIQNVQFAVADTAKTYALPNQNPPGTVNFTMSTCSGSTITLRNSGYSNFAGYGVPNGSGNITAIYTVFGTTKQLTIRDTTDVPLWSPRCGSGGGGGTGGGTGTGNLLNETFETQVVPASSPFNAINISGWQNATELGTQKYFARQFGTPTNKYAQITAFGSAQASVTSWLVTGGINLGAFATKTLSFDSKAGFANGATLKVLVSTNYTGTGNPWAAGVTWTDLTSQATLSPGLSSGYPTDFTNSGNINLNSYSGTIYVAFKYEGADPSGSGSDKTTTWQIDNIKVSGL